MRFKWLVIVLAVGMSACQKTEKLQPVTSPNGGNKPIEQFDIAGQKLIAQGDFMSNNAYTTSGSIKLYEKEGKQTLVFDNFKTSAGPDLRIYLSEDKVASKFVEVSNKVNLGDYIVQLPSAVDHKTKKFVLIWCKQFSVLFGNAELK